MFLCIMQAMPWNLEAVTVTLHEPGAQPNALAEAFPVAPIHPSRNGPLAFLGKTLTIAEWEVRKLRHDPTDLVTRTVQPALWLLVFGESCERPTTNSQRWV